MPSLDVKPRVVYVTTHGQSARLMLVGQLAFLQQQGFEVVVICSPDHGLEKFARLEGVAFHTVNMRREPSPFRDLVNLVQIAWLMFRLKPQIVNAGTPKGGLLGMISAWIARVPVRIYTLRGLRLETTHGWKRWILNASEKIASACSHQVVCNSESLREIYVRLGMTSRSKTTVLGSGSGNGVDVKRFEFNSQHRKKAEEVRSSLGIPTSATIIGYVGRLTRDKGIEELVKAYSQLSAVEPEIYLLLIGGFEAGDAVDPEIIQQVEQHPRIFVTGLLLEITHYYSLFDIVVLPSYREGFPNVALEAAAAQLPIVGYRATGTVDAVEHGVTGELVPVGSVNQLAAAIRKLIRDKPLSARMGQAARERVCREFAREKVWQAWTDCYQGHLLKRGLAAAAICDQHATKVAA